MPLIGPQGASALAAGFNAQGLMENLRRQALQNRAAEGELESQRRALAGQQLVAEALKRVLGPNKIIPAKTTRTPAAATPPVTKGAGDGTITTEELPAPAAAQPTPAQGGTAAAPTPSSGSPAQPPAQTPAQEQKKASWRDVLADIAQRTDVDDGVKFAAMQEIEKQVAAEEQREFKAQETQRAREAKLYSDLQVLEARYRMAGNNAQEQARIKGEYDLKMQELRNLGSANVAGINANARRDVAAATNASRENIALARNATQMGMQEIELAYKKDFDRQNLDLKADSQAKNFLLKSRQLDYMKEGLDQKQAQFQANLDYMKIRDKMRDETTRRGQDLALERAQAAQLAKMSAADAKVAAAMPRVIDNFDKLAADAEALLNMPGLESATGPIDSMLLTLFGDTANFEEAVKSLQAQIGFQALAEMRAASPTGGALGNVSNREVEFLQATIRSLNLRQDADQFRQNLLDIVDHARRAKARTLSEYEAKFGANRPTGGPVPANALKAKPGGETRDLPPELVNEPPETVVREGNKTFVIRGGKLVETGG